MNEIEKAYAAGLFDGEGCISSTGHKPTSSISISFTNTNLELCEFFGRLWGGHLRTTESSKPNVSIIFRWLLNGKKAEQFLLDIQPYSIGKAYRISLALEFIKTIGAHGVSPLRDKLALRQEIVKKINLANHTKGSYSSNIQFRPMFGSWGLVSKSRNL